MSICEQCSQQSFAIFTDVISIDHIWKGIQYIDVYFQILSLLYSTSFR